MKDCDYCLGLHLILLYDSSQSYILKLRDGGSNTPTSVFEAGQATTGPNLKRVQTTSSPLSRAARMALLLQRSGQERHAQRSGATARIPPFPPVPKAHDRAR